MVNYTAPQAGKRPVGKVREVRRPYMVRDLEKAGAEMLKQDEITKRIPLSQFEKFMPLYNKDMVNSLQTNNKEHWKYLWGQFVSEIGLYNDFIIVDHFDNEVLHLPAVFLKASSITGDTNHAVANKYQSAVYLNAGNPNHLEETTDEYVNAIYKSQLTDENLKKLQVEIAKQAAIAKKADQTLRGPNVVVPQDSQDVQKTEAGEENKQSFTKVEATIEWDFD